MKKSEIDAKSYVEELFGVNSSNTSVIHLPDDYAPVDELAELDREFDLVKLMSRAVDPHTGIPRNIKIPEGDFPEAKNYFDFCGNFLGPDVRFPFTRQMWICIHLLGEYCPRCSHPKWNTGILTTPLAFDARNLPDRVRFLNYGKCPKCKATKAELIARGELNPYTETALCLGQRAGKSTVTASLSAYILHKYLKFPKMSSVCEGIQASTPLTATFVGLRFADAYGLLWDPIVKNIDGSPWFQEMHSMLDDYGKRLGIEFYRKKDIYIKYMHKNLEFYPAGPSKRALRGRTRILTATDEIGWFPVGADNKDRERADADEVYTALDRSLLTMRREVRTLYKKGFSNFLPAIAVNISSPADQSDKINRLVEENRDSKNCLALRLPTWEVSPMYSRNEGEIAEAFRKDPVIAERDYGANPPLNSAKFITKENVLRCFAGLNRVTTNVERAIVNDEYRRYGSIATSMPMQPCPATLMSIDAGFSNNSFSATVLYPTQIKNGDALETTLHVPVVLEIQPAPGEKLHYTKIYKNVLKPVMEAFNVRYFFADRWNSIALLDTAAGDFAKVELIAKQYSVKYVDFQVLRSYLEESKILLPVLDMDLDKIMAIDSYPTYFESSPVAHLLFQMVTVKDTGTTVTKGGVYTDDNFRALALGVSRVLDPKILPELLKLGAKVTRPKLVGAISAGRTMGINNTYLINRGQAAAVSSSPQLALGNSSSTGSSLKGNSVVIRTSR